MMLMPIIVYVSTTITMALLVSRAFLGSVNPAVTPATLQTTICAPGWAESVRPPTSYTGPIKARLLRQAGATEARAYQLDHVIPLELGGDPRALTNFALQPESEALMKDRVEDAVHADVCAGKLTLAKGQAIFGDWSWRLTKDFSVSTGLRYTKETKRAVVLNQTFANDSFSGTPLTTPAN